MELREECLCAGKKTGNTICVFLATIGPAQACVNRAKIRPNEASTTTEYNSKQRIPSGPVTIIAGPKQTEGGESMTKEKHVWNLGCEIRAARLGWHRLPGQRKGLLRIYDAENDNVRCQFHPMSLVPNNKTKEGHRVWWDGPDRGQYVIELSPYIRAIRAVYKPFEAILNNDGLLVLAGVSCPI